jgi:KDO2-lipid IV(A) lauroyltransferase
MVKDRICAGPIDGMAAIPHGRSDCFSVFSGGELAETICSRMVEAGRLREIDVSARQVSRVTPSSRFGMRKDSPVQRFGHWLVYLLVRVFISLVQAVRIETCQRAARVLAWLLYDVVKLRRRVVDENLSIAMSELSPAERTRVAREMWEHLILMVCEIAHAPRKIHETNWRDYVTVSGKPEMVGLMLSGRPCVAVTAHFGNFEIAGFISGVLGFSTFTVARTLDNPYLDEYLNRFRELKGQFILPKVGSAPQADAVLETNGTLVLLGDQNAGKRGVWIDFMGRPASCHKALALFTLLSRAPMMVVYCRRLEQPLKFEFGLAGVADPLCLDDEQGDVRGLTQWYNRLLEQEIRRTPHQYWWVHRRWKEMPPRRRSAKAAPSEALQEQRPAA